MLKLSHAALINISGFIWAIAGFMLMRLGLTLLLIDSPGASPLLSLLGPYIGGRFSAIFFLLILAFAMGYLKGRHVLGKSARKAIARIKTFPNPTSLLNIYSAKYYLLLGGMIALGISIKYLGIPNDIRGAIDAAIGIALLTGAQFYFRQAAAMKKEPVSEV
jgi:hypothetical protein